MALISVPTTLNVQPDMHRTSEGTAALTTNPDEKQPTEGASLEYALTIDDILADDFVQPKGYHWYFLRVNYGRAEKLYNQLKDRKDGYLIWMPCQKIVSYYDGRRIEALEPIFKSNLFIYATEQQAFSLTHRAPEGFSYVDFSYDHTEQNEFGRDHKMKVRFNEMLNFIRLEHVHHPWAHVVPAEKIHLRPGGMVRVIDGSFKGVEGYVARVYGQTRVVVTIKGIVNYATAYVSQKNLMPIEESESQDAQKKPEAGNSVRNRAKRHEIKVGIRIPDNEKLQKRRKNKTK